MGPLIQLTIEAGTIVMLWHWTSKRQAQVLDDVVFSHGLIPTAVGLVLISGWLVLEGNCRLISQNSERQTQAQALGIAHMLQSDNLSNLNFAPSDTSKPIFRRTQALFAAYGNYVGIRSIYTMIQREGKFIFGPENLNDQDPYPSIPGSAYENPPAPLTDAFIGANPFSLKHAPDNYGEIVSSFAPVVNYSTAEVTHVVGVDQDTQALAKALRKARLQVMAVEFGILLVLLLGLWCLLSREAKVFSLWNLRERNLETILTFVAGLMMVACVSLELRVYEKNVLVYQFQSLSEERFTLVRRHMEAFREDLSRLTKFLNSHPNTNESEFADLVNPFVKASTAKAWEWVPRGPSPVGPYPVTWVVPLAGNEKAKGFNLGSETLHLQSIQNCLQQHLPTASAPVDLVQETGTQKGMLFLNPVFTSKLTTGIKATDSAKIRGFAVAVLRLQATLENSVRGLQNNHLVDLELVDLGNTRDPVPESVGRVLTNGGIRSTEFKAIAPIFLHDRAFALMAYPTESFFSHRQFVLEIVGDFGLAVYPRSDAGSDGFAQTSFRV